MKLSVTLAALGFALASPALANMVYVSNEKGNTITVIDSDTWDVVTEFDAGNRPRGIGVSPDGKYLYVCASDDDQIRVFDDEFSSTVSDPNKEYASDEHALRVKLMTNYEPDMVPVQNINHTITVQFGIKITDLNIVSFDKLSCFVPDEDLLLGGRKFGIIFKDFV